jgi:hypothetical protein
MQRLSGETGRFAVSLSTETAPFRKFAAHVFDIGAEMRVPGIIYNYSEWLVGTTGIEPVTPTMSR